MGLRLVLGVTNGDFSCKKAPRSRELQWKKKKKARKTKMLDSNVTVRDTSVLIIPVICKGATWQI